MAAKPRTQLCDGCEEVRRTVRTRKATGEELCDSCYRKHLQPRRACDGCGKQRVTAKWVRGRALCQTCYVTGELIEACSLCGHDRTVVMRDDDGRAICAPCRSRQRVEPCVDCGRERPVAVRAVGGGAVCHSCFHRRNVAPCVHCKREAPVAKRTSTGRPVCDRCYERRYREMVVCAICREAKRKAGNDERGRGVCLSCWERHVRRRVPCGACGKVDIVKQVVDGEPRCQACYKAGRAPELCGLCNEVRAVEGRLESGQAVCARCHTRERKPRHRCAECGKVKRTKQREATGTHVCNSCYTKKFRPQSRCDSCGRVRPVGRRSDAQVLCTSCARRVHRQERRRRASGQAGDAVDTG